MNCYEARERLTALALQHGDHMPLEFSVLTATGDELDTETAYVEITEIESVIKHNGRRIIALKA